MALNSERLIMRITDALVSDGYKEAGYEYVVIDDCWSELDRDKASGKLVPHRERFPNGMKYIGDYVSKYNNNLTHKLFNNNNNLLVHQYNIYHNLPCIFE